MLQIALFIIAQNKEGNKPNLTDHCFYPLYPLGKESINHLRFAVALLDLYFNGIFFSSSIRRFCSDCNGLSLPCLLCFHNTPGSYRGIFLIRCTPFQNFICLLTGSFNGCFYFYFLSGSYICFICLYYYLFDSMLHNLYRIRTRYTRAICCCCSDDSLPCCFTRYSTTGIHNGDVRV